MRLLNVPPRTRLPLIAAATLLVLAGAATVWWATGARAPGAAVATGCIPDPAPFLAMDLQAFDQGPSGWRRFEMVLDCEAETADLIRAYRDRHAPDLTPAQATGLYWHEGQLRASAGETVPAALLMERSIFAGEDRWSVLYKEATVAFLRRDRGALERARAALASLPAEDRRVGSTVSREIPNLARVDGLIACFDRPYDIAYACTSAPSQAGQRPGAPRD
ncbi:hypothetical protein BrevBR_15405 [Brevundimonas sp. BR2-1]|uniref:hypothetical protein n=1 Tax=Brevundimonas sp. BR2-1 TaxID=3031123 RepID=UPI0030B6BDBF